MFSCLFVSLTSLAFLGTQQNYVKPLPNLSLILDPQSMEDSYSFQVSSQIYDTLFEFDEFLGLQSKLAESYQLDNDGKTIAIKLRPNIKFHNEKKFNADDVIYTMRRFIKKTYYRYPEVLFIEGAYNFISGKTNSIPGLKKTSDLSLNILLTIPSPTFIMLLATPSSGILPLNLNGLMEDHFFEAPIGTGPFAIEKFNAGRDLQLKANKNYFRGEPKLDRILYKYATRDQAVDGFNKGLFSDLEWYNVDPKEIKVSFNVTKFPLPQTVLLLFNTKSPPFNNKSARKAFSLAIDKTKLMSECFADKVMAQGFIPFGIGGYNRNLANNEFNIAKAKQIMNSQKTKLQNQINILWMEHHPCGGKFDKSVKNDLLSVGFLPNFKYITYSDFLEATNKTHNYNVIETRLAADYPDAISMLNYFKSNYKYNFSGFSSKKYDALIEKALNTIDKHARYNLYQECSKLLEEEVASINLYYDVQSIIYQKNVRGIKVIPTAFLAMPLNNVYLEE